MKRSRIIMILYILVFLLAVYMKFLYMPPTVISRAPISVIIGNRVNTETVRFSKKVSKETFLVGIFKKVDSDHISYDRLLDIKRPLPLPLTTLLYDAKLLGFRFRTTPIRSGLDLQLIAKQSFIMDRPIRDSLAEAVRINTNRQLNFAEDGEIRRGSVVGSASVKKEDTLILKSSGDLLQVWSAAMIEGNGQKLEIDFKRIEDKKKEGRSNFNKLSVDFSGEKIRVSSEPNKLLEADVENAFSIDYKAITEPVQGRKYCIDITKKPDDSGAEQPDFDYFQMSLLSVEYPPSEFHVTYPPSNNWVDNGNAGNPWTVGLPYSSVVNATHAIQIAGFRRGNEDLRNSLIELPNLGRTTYRVAVPRLLTNSDRFDLRYLYDNQEGSITWTVGAQAPQFAIYPPVRPIKFSGPDRKVYEDFLSNNGSEISYESREVYIFPQLIGVGNNVSYSVLYDNNVINDMIPYNNQAIQLRIRPDIQRLKIRVYSEGHFLREFEAGIRNVPDCFTFYVVEARLGAGNVLITFAVRDNLFLENIELNNWQLSSNPDRPLIVYNRDNIARSCTILMSLVNFEDTESFNVRITQSPFSNTPTLPPNSNACSVFRINRAQIQLH